MSTPARPPHILVLGDSGDLANALLRRLAGTGEARPTISDAEAKQALFESDWTAVTIMTRDDALALRLTLLCAHVRPDLPLWVTLFDRTVVHQLRSIVPRVNVVSPADLAARELTQHCLAAGARAVPAWKRGVRLVDDALRLLAAAGAGLTAILALEVLMGITALHEGLLDSFYAGARVLATITDPRSAERGPTWFKVVSTISALVGVALVAVFTAALVRRLSRRRLTTLWGPRSAPRRGHVITVGLGQVGFRLAQALLSQGIPVLAVERNENAPCVRLARGAGIPVAIADARDRQTLELAGVARAVTVAVVTSDDLVNVAVGLGAADVAPETPLVFRLGDGDVAAETESLLHLGRICDLHDIVANELADALQ